ncbi:response regulator [Marinomonas mediterranea]|uniref:Transcriptional regulatory protein n=1 Tax=Marinomonas mediterranea (strain ATCC 700492 / JCM 21426 / NBRC 103028 / MMB-1) TaxID=717774 RepID=F2K0Q2_MARM1|nr:response regulator [Marinomonas mediterranea]ADZ92144.1 response regulator receiver and unknown domain protein [Marinomonas mediterranea MMB-1]WCN10109.1 response regulator [Marinomonas mediterranea]WCN14151.1 response regulator [Marinomonas mediterranea]WCN18207.1 response regulator [Marinomonas mediterranea MMB-1]
MSSVISVVIVEDDVRIAEIQKRFLERINGVELVGIAHGLAEARDLISILKPDLLLLDVQFPDGNGLDLLRDIRAEDQSTDIILITAARETETLRAALHGGIFDYILKPLVFERLRDALNNYMTHLEKLNALQTFAQNDVDQLLGNTSGNAAQQLPKGIDALTLNKVAEVVREAAEPLNAEEVGKLINASRTTARRYLEYLVSYGELMAEVSYGSVGRPERKYSLTKKAS